MMSKLKKESEKRISFLQINAITIKFLEFNLEFGAWNLELRNLLRNKLRNFHLSTKQKN